ncbi:uncharacterized protein LAJ45_06843 [Morchella importuna]|uniref:uncharacterized protein n=1 Tax=Morchella importuna TaxID=1174673 RepID=UPI001E8E7494|nr:uncharacterized protein LAJ45_06843 [Morchella importuna]KAH8149303.1 hypothetical protein LAJ45_06843 [Morchella importuna]
MKFTDFALPGTKPYPTRQFIRVRRGLHLSYDDLLQRDVAKPYVHVVTEKIRKGNGTRKARKKKSRRAPISASSPQPTFGVPTYPSSAQPPLAALVVIIRPFR